MVDRPIIFSAPMVRALLAGRKTQTRRMMGHEPMSLERWADLPSETQESLECDGWLQFGPVMARPNYAVGDRLWVREAYALLGKGSRSVVFRAEHEECQSAGPRVDVRWHPSIHMPRWASRLTLDVTDVRVQRLQDISDEDARAEGTQEPSLRDLGGDLTQAAWSERQIFERLWRHLHGPSAWAANPWVPALTFTVRLGNIDAVERAPEAMSELAHHG